ncbi:hypothetical protein [Flavobacterium sp. N1736]|uniref:hypothetical protein n=1 Tax=Flavobacterium sp. N1736 TaxID=2986823 RepID=UPI002224AAD0|nr:hypothetical protein [Flavobacterium sp. N1736]
MIKNYFYITIIAFIFLNCQKRDSNIPQKIDEIEFSYINSRRIPFNEVKIKIARMSSNDSALVFVQTRPAIYTTRWEYSKIEKFMTIDIKIFNKFADVASSFNKINIGKAFADEKDGSTWQIQFGSKGKNQSYSFWSPDYDTQKRGLTTFVNLSEQIIEVSKLKKEEILED